MVRGGRGPLGLRPPPRSSPPSGTTSPKRRRVCLRRRRRRARLLLRDGVVVAAGAAAILASPPLLGGDDGRNRPGGVAGAERGREPPPLSPPKRKTAGSRSAPLIPLPPPPTSVRRDDSPPLPDDGDRDDGVIPPWRPTFWDGGGSNDRGGDVGGDAAGPADGAAEMPPPRRRDPVPPFALFRPPPPLAPSGETNDRDAPPSASEAGTGGGGDGTIPGGGAGAIDDGRGASFVAVGSGDRPPDFVASPPPPDDPPDGRSTATGTAATVGSDRVGARPERRPIAAIAPAGVEGGDARTARTGNALPSSVVLVMDASSVVGRKVVRSLLRSSNVAVRAVVGKKDVPWELPDDGDGDVDADGRLEVVPVDFERLDDPNVVDALSDAMEGCRTVVSVDVDDGDGTIVRSTKLRDLLRPSRMLRPDVSDWAKDDERRGVDDDRGIHPYYATYLSQKILLKLARERGAKRIVRVSKLSSTLSPFHPIVVRQNGLRSMLGRYRCLADRSYREGGVPCVLLRVGSIVDKERDRETTSVRLAKPKSLSPLFSRVGASDLADLAAAIATEASVSRIDGDGDGKEEAEEEDDNHEGGRPPVVLAIDRSYDFGAAWARKSERIPAAHRWGRPPPVGSESDEKNGSVEECLADLADDGGDALEGFAFETSSTTSDDAGSDGPLDRRNLGGRRADAHGAAALLASYVELVALASMLLYFVLNLILPIFRALLRNDH